VNESKYSKDQGEEIIPLEDTGQPVLGCINLLSGVWIIGCPAIDAHPAIIVLNHARKNFLSKKKALP
jgi:hypothetical protein